MLILLFSSNLHANPAFSFSKYLNADHFSPAEGLSQNYVFDVVQDHEGFLWVATQDGLNKFDGQSFTHYRNDFYDPNSIADNFIRNLHITQDGTLWIGTQNGLSRYNAEQDNFVNYRASEDNNQSLSDNLIWAVYEDKYASFNSTDKKQNTNNLWVTTQNGLHKYNSESDSFTPIKIRKISNSEVIPLTEVKTIFQDDKGFYWISTYEQGFIILNKNLTLADSFKKRIEASIGKPINSIRDIKSDNNYYWLATDVGLHVLNKNYEKQSQFNFEGSALENSLVTEVSILEEHHYWVATEQGLYSVNPLNESFAKHQYEETLADRIVSLTVDTNKNLWIGTLHGLFTVKGSKNVVKNIHSNITGHIDHIDALHYYKNKVWFESDNELFQFSPITQKVIKEADLNTSIYQILNNDEHLILFSDSGDLIEFNTETQEQIIHANWEQQSSYANDKRVFHSQGLIWYIDIGGKLSTYDLNTKKFNVINQDQEFITNGAKTKDGFWLVNKSGKILDYSIEKNTFTEFSFKNSTKFDLTRARTIIESADNLVIGTDGTGALVISKGSKHAYFYNEHNGLANNFINDIIVDKQNNIWFSTNKAITVLTPQQKLRNFNHEFLTNIEYLSQSSTIDQAGNIYLGGNLGFDYFSPDLLLNFKQQLTLPVFTDLLIANKVVEISAEKTDNFTIPKRFSDLAKITLQYSHSPFSFEFIAPNSKLSTQVAYRYKLHGVDDRWLETTIHNLRATYTNLASGHYLFEVQAYDIYNPNEFKSNSVNIEILPPWWLSNSAVLIYSLVCLLILAYMLQQFRHKRLYHLQIKTSEERLKLSLWGSGDEMWDWNIKKGKIYRSNIWGVLEFPQDGKRNLGNNNDNETNINQADIKRITHALQDHFDEKTAHFEATYRVKDKNGQWIWVLDRGKIVERDEKNAPIRMTGTLKDISQVKKADERLKLFAKCFENISDAVVIYDRQFNVVDINKAFHRITGKTKRQMIGTPLNFRQYDDSFTNSVKQHLLTKGSWHGEIESQRENGECYLTDLNIDIIRDENNSISHFVGVFSDITKRKETEAELRKLANTDTLTGLPNRSYFQANQSRLVKNKIPHALLVFDLDNFKKVNDSMGHEVGDVLLCKVAERIRSVGRKQDTVYRLGGDEFSIIIENTNDIHTITSIAKHILRTIAEPLKLKNHEIVLYSSIGIVLYPEDGTTPQELLKNADTAMYHAKNEGGNRYKFFNGTMNEQAVKRLQIEGLIRHGLKEDYFSVFYQPKIEIATGKIAGMEALVRFETPSKGIISPVTFIPVSEETGQIIEIGEVVLRKACFATKKWIDEGLFDGRCAVNLSAVQFTQPNLVGMITDILKEANLPSKYLELEITEGTVMNSPQQAIDTMLQLRAMGIHLSLDDFGTGYSSLAYLKKFPLNTLKIDKAFVDDIEHSEQGRNMVATIVTIAHNLGLQVVAEGVETNQQLSFLSGLRCEQLQGYLYSKPLSTNNFRSYLFSHQITDKSTSFS
ncbi:diguanylate cyclase [Thalassotalea marina]|uniref:Diguanylate cyclase n=1 Tax=Thalassotalea marina TaxID=1673741 RepID=A0A919BD13_9GAMM|nr:diguanylate cyclase [Thalassotalea marina]